VISQSTAAAASMTAVKNDPAVIVAFTGNDIYPPPHSRSINPSTTPHTHVETDFSRCRKLPPKLQALLPPLKSQTQMPAQKSQELPPPPKLQVQTLAPKAHEKTLLSKSQEQAPPTRSTPQDEITLSVMESTNVKFSGGFAIEKIGTAFESVWFVIEDIPGSVGLNEIKHLAAPFGVVQEVRVRDEKQGDNSGVESLHVYRWAGPFHNASFAIITSASPGLYPVKQVMLGIARRKPLKMP
jgi:hypothetical protein